MKKKHLFHTVKISFLFKFIAIHNLSNLKCLLLPTLSQRRSMNNLIPGFCQLLANIRICRFSPWFVFGTAWLPFAGVHCKMPACQSAESVQNNTHQPTKTVQRKHCMQSTFEDDICCVSNIIVYDKVSDDFIFLSIKDTCPNQNLVAHHQFLENLPGKAFETHWQFTGILIIYNGRHAKSKSDIWRKNSGIIFLGP